MNNWTSKQRKFLYLIAIGILLIPIVMLGLPATGGTGGGKLAQKRIEYQLGESTLGEVDPSSASMNLMLLGLRGVATDLLWMQATDELKTKQWQDLESTVRSIKLLQPHFRNVWEFQSWNLAYNVSAECDAVEDRFFWVKKGIRFLIEGVQRNLLMPELVHSVGHMVAYKIGKSDEKKLFRQFYATDPDPKFNGDADETVNPNKKVDNFLAAQDFYREANLLVQDKGLRQRKMDVILFLAFAHKMPMESAMALQDEGKFGEEPRERWAEGYRAWTTDFGRKEIKSSLCNIILVPTKEEFEDLLEKANKERREHNAPEMASKELAEYIGRSRDTANFDSWQQRAKLESTKELSSVRRDLYEGRMAFINDQDYARSRAQLERAMPELDKLLQQHEVLLEQIDLIQEGLKAVLTLKQIYTLLGEPMPERYPLRSYWESPRFGQVRAEIEREFQTKFGTEFGR